MKPAPDVYSFATGTLPFFSALFQPGGGGGGGGQFLIMLSVCIFVTSTRVYRVLAAVVSSLRERIR